MIHTGFNPDSTGHLIAEYEWRQASLECVFRGLPQNYTNLYIVGQLRTLATTAGGIGFQVGRGTINASAVYATNRYGLGNGSCTASCNYGAVSGTFFVCAGNNNAAGAFSPVELWITGYSNPNMNTSVTYLYGYALGISGFGNMTTGLGFSTYQVAEPIDTLRIFSTANFVAGSYLEIYGLT